MSENPIDKHEPVSLMILKGLIYCFAVLLIVGPLASWPGCLAALAAIPAGFLLSRRMMAWRVRFLVVLAAAVVTFALGLVAEWALGRSDLAAHWLGFRGVLGLDEILLFGLCTLACVAGLRTAAARFPIFMLVEAATVIAAVVSWFVGHRYQHISQPQFFSDWALVRGYEPNLAMVVIGVLTVAAVSVLLFEGQRLRRALTAVTILLLLGVTATIVWHMFWPHVKLVSNDGNGGNGGMAQSSGKPGAKGQGQSQSPPQLGFEPSDQPEHPRPMAVVNLHNDYTPPRGYYYFRQDSFSQYNGVRLVRAVEPGFDTDVPGQFPTAHVAVPGQPLDKNIEDHVSMTISLIAPHPRPFALTNAQSMDPRENADPATFIATYEVTADALSVPLWKVAKRKGGDPAWTDAMRKHYLTVPEDPRYARLAGEILAKGIDEENLAAGYQKSPVLRALAIGRWIEKNTVYSRHNVPHVEGDPTAAFLFGERRGYCVHIAHAMAYLMRTQGIPARVAVGYAVDASRRGRGSSILIQETDAHAWCEIYLNGIGWVVADASPERTEEPPSPDVDRAAQTQFGKKNRVDPPPAPEPERNPPKPVWAYWPWAVGIPLLLLACLYIIKAWRRLAPKFASPRYLYRVCYRAVLDRLADVGMVRRFGETREEFAQRLVGWAPELAPLSAAHVRRAIGGLEVADPRDWLVLQAQVATRIATAFPLRRRALGLLHPWNWLQTN